MVSWPLGTPVRKDTLTDRCLHSSSRSYTGQGSDRAHRASTIRTAGGVSTCESRVTRSLGGIVSRSPSRVGTLSKVTLVKRDTRVYLLTHTFSVDDRTPSQGSYQTTVS